ncbi:MAG: LysR family transcriptional regulator, partial [Oscillospiraceae bacterium]
TLYVSQSSLSQQIAKLEKEIGYPLFQRTTKYVHLTPEGTRFLAQAKKVLEEFGALHDQVEATRASMEHTINLGMSVVYRPDAAEAVVRFMHTHPEIDVNLISAWELDLVEMLHSGRIDLALFGVDWENDDLSGMTAIPLHDERVVASMSPLHPLAQRESVTLAELADETLIFTSERSAVRRLVLQRFRQMGIHVTNCMEINDTETRIHYVSQNIGVAFAMDSTHHWQKQPNSLRIPIEPKMVRTYSLVTSVSGAARHPAAIKQLQDFLVQNLKQCEPT